MPTRRNHPGRINLRRERAQERAVAREALGDAGQLARLEKANLGHTKEAKRLQAKLAKV